MYRVILDHPQTQGNLGFIARSMENFEMDELYLVDPEFDIGGEAKKTAMHAKGLLENLKIVESIEEAIKDLDYVAGTTGVKTTDKNVLRNGITAEQFAERAGEVEGKLGLLFGKEDKGLRNKDLELCDFVVNIPTSENYPVMNLSHAASVVFYELFKNQKKSKKDIGNVKKEKEILEKTFKDVLTNLSYPEEKKAMVSRCFKNMVGRSFLFRREAHSLLGAFKKINRKLREI